MRVVLFATVLRAQSVLLQLPLCADERDEWSARKNFQNSRKERGRRGGGDQGKDSEGPAVTSAPDY